MSEQVADLNARRGTAPPDVWDAGPDGPPSRPEPTSAMFHGSIGEFSLAAAEHTEADPVAVLAHALVLFGAALNAGPHQLAGNDRHTGALFALVVGDTAKARKGTSLAVARGLLAEVDAGLNDERLMSGFGSGEALIAKLAPSEGGAAPDTRLVVVESEFASVLARAKREGSTVSAVLRDGWDGRPLENRTRGGGELVADGYHLAVIGHITSDELRAKLADGEAFNGFANRFLHVAVRRGQLRPDGGNVPPELFADYGRTLRRHLTNARKLGLGRVGRTDVGSKAWRELYLALEGDDPPGMLGRVLARASAHAARLALVFALADGARAIDAEHIEAAAAVWSYCRASAALIYGDRLGEPDADTLLAALREAGPRGMNATQQRDLFGRHAGRAPKARDQLIAAGLARTVKVPTGGHPEGRTYAIKPTPPHLRSLSSLSSQSHAERDR